MSISKYLFYYLAFAAVLVSCQQPGGNTTGSEYMPDMAHSIAYEANTYTDYSLNVWEKASVKDRKSLTAAMLPVEGTIPRGNFSGQSTAAKAQMNGTATTNAISIPANGAVPYYYGDNESERSRAVANIISNPYPITAAGLDKGKALYDVQCGICHGAKGDGNGWLVDEANLDAKYPAAPANFMQDTFYNSTNGRFYHAIMYGKNVMGGYADKLSYEERWQVIHYVHALMAKAKKLEYSEKANTLTSNLADRPALLPKAKTVTQHVGEVIEAVENHGHGHDTGGGHGHDADGQGHDADGHGHDTDAGHGDHH